MLHIGDITKVNGAQIEPVDCITGGSPCQDLSVAGKRAGLAGERSGLFMDQIRIIKEMRAKDEANGRTNVDVRPRYMVWENVPGAFSSNKGEDFRAVLEETARIKDSNAVIPEFNGRWPNAGTIVGNGWSIAWRVHDAQFWGVPQRRRRIALVADFGADTAPQILFERKSMSGNFEQSSQTGEDIAATVGRSIESASNQIAFGISSYSSNSMLSNNPKSGIYKADTSRTLDNNGGNPACNQGGIIVLEGNGSRPSHKGDGYIESEIMYTLNSTEHHAVSYTDVAISFQERAGKPGGGKGILIQKDRTGALSTFNNQSVCWDGGQISPTLTNRNASGSQRMPNKNNFTAVITQNTPQVYGSSSFGNYSEKPGTLKANGGDVGGGSENLVQNGYVVRRLTPLECERLQGYPDGWTDIGEWIDTKGKKHKPTDSPRYKALGNSIALPFWFWLLQRISAQYTNTPTLGSLFDGIGGFPLCWEKINGKGTAKWASEIEEFPIAVTKKRFPENNRRKK